MSLTTPIDVQGRVAVITGAARGMGAAYVRGFLAEGALVVATDRSWAGSEAFRDELNATGKVLVDDMDVTNDAAIDAVYRATLDRYGTADILVNNAAMRMRDLYPPSGRYNTLLDTKDEDWAKLYSVNVFGVLKVIRRFIQPMIEKRRGSIVSVISSGALFFSHGGGYFALRPDSKEQPYMSSKAALANLTFYLAAEMKEYNIAANIVVPGHTRTTGFDEQNRARLAAGARPGPPPMKPEHMVPIVLHLASQDANGVTGRMYDVMTWNVEHGLGGPETWADTSFSYEGLAATR